MTRAAARLGIQQPPLSQQIKALEQELGVLLFTRGSRGMELTIAGQAFQQDAQAIIASVSRAAQRAVQAARGETGRLRLGVTTSAVVHRLVPQIIRAFRQAYPQVTLDLREHPAAELTEAVMRGELQFALLRVPVARPRGLAFLELAREELLAVLPAGHALIERARRQGLWLHDLAEEGFILVRRPAAPGLYENLVAACRTAGFEPAVVAEVPHMLTGINLVSAGAGISFVPASMKEVNLRQVAYLSIHARPALDVPLTLAWLEDGDDPVIQNFLTIARRSEVEP